MHHFTSRQFGSSQGLCSSRGEVSAGLRFWFRFSAAASSSSGGFAAQFGIEFVLVLS